MPSSGSKPFYGSWASHISCVRNCTKPRVSFHPVESANLAACCGGYDVYRVAFHASHRCLSCPDAKNTVPPYQRWALSVFFIFFNNKKWFFPFFIKLVWLGVGFLNRTGAEVGYWLDKKCKKIIFYDWKNSKIPQVPSSASPYRWPAISTGRSVRPTSCSSRPSCSQGGGFISTWLPTVSIGTAQKVSSRNCTMDRGKKSLYAYMSDICAKFDGKRYALKEANSSQGTFLPFLRNSICTHLAVSVFI